MEAKKLNEVSWSEYLDLEVSTGKKYEFHNGEVFAMSGGTLDHGLISGNAFGEIKFALKNANRDCTAINNDVKLFIKAEEKFVYPDAMVVCGPIEVSDEMVNAVVNPVIIIEVLSKSTEAYDRGDKFHSYRQIPSLREYVLIDQDKARVEIFRKRSDLWRIDLIEGVNQSFRLESIDLEFDLASFYDGISWSI